MSCVNVPWGVKYYDVANSSVKILHCIFATGLPQNFDVFAILWTFAIFLAFVILARKSRNPWCITLSYFFFKFWGKVGNLTLVDLYSVEGSVLCLVMLFRAYCAWSNFLFVSIFKNTRR